MGFSRKFGPVKISCYTVSECGHLQINVCEGNPTPIGTYGVPVSAPSLDTTFSSIHRLMFVELHSFLLTSLFLQGVFKWGRGWEETVYIWRGDEWVGRKDDVWVLGGRWVVRCAGVIGVLRG